MPLSPPSPEHSLWTLSGRFATHVAPWKVAASCSAAAGPRWPAFCMRSQSATSCGSGGRTRCGCSGFSGSASGTRRPKKR